MGTGTPRRSTSGCSSADGSEPPLDAGFVAPPLLSTIKFVVIVFAVQAMLLWAVYRTTPDARTGRRRVLLTAGAFALVLAGSAALAESGLLAADPRRAVAFAAGTNLLVLLLALARPGAALAAAVAPVYWVLFQGFRLPLEIVLHAWGEAGTIPLQMTWEGQNLDVVTGASALLLGAAWLARPRATWLGWIVHALGLVLLLNVGRIAVLSLPTGFKAFEGPPLLLPFHAPYVWILPFAVAAALFGHVVGIRGLLKRS